MKRIVFIILVIIIICYFQYNYINEISDSLEILQYENPKKNIFENILQDKLISVFTSINLLLTINGTVLPEKTDSFFNQLADLPQ